MMMASKRDGVDLGRDPQKDVVEQTGALPPVPVFWRRRLRGIVVATVSCCALILVAAAISRVSHASNASRGAIAPAAAMVNDPTSAANASVGPAKTAVAAPVEAAPTRGIVRVERPAVAGRVWLDGKRLTTSTTTIACGAHQVKIGPSGRMRSLDVPCGGELVVSR